LEEKETERKWETWHKREEKGRE